MRHAVRLYLLWHRLELVLIAILPAGLIFESSIANMAAYGGGPVGFLRGLFFEIVTYACARTAKLLIQRNRRYGAALFIGAIALFAAYVSAVNNLGWVLTGHDIGGFFTAIGSVMPSGLYGLYKVGLAILLPLAVMGIALVDLDHFVHDVLAKDTLDIRAMEVAESEMHRKAYLRSQKKQHKAIAQEYDDIAGTRAKSFVGRVRGGDLSFSSGTARRQGLQQIAPAGSQAAPPVQVTPVSVPRPQIVGGQTGQPSRRP